MTKSTIFILAVLVAAFAFGNFSAAAQTPEQIEVKSLQITYRRFQTDTFFSLKTINAAKNEVEYSGVGSYSLGLFNCTPCNFVATFNTNLFARPDAFAFRWGFDKFVNFYLTETASAPVVLRPTISRRRKTFSVKGASKIKGRVEITNERGVVIAEDKNVQLDGGYTVDFFQNSLHDGRKVEFSEIRYSLIEPNN